MAGPEAKKRGKGGSHGRKNKKADSQAEVKRLQDWLTAAAPPRGSLGLGLLGEAAAPAPAKRKLSIGELRVAGELRVLSINCALHGHALVPSCFCNSLPPQTNYKIFALGDHKQVRFRFDTFLTELARSFSFCTIY